MKISILHDPGTLGVVFGVCFGIIARLLLLRTDYRQYPTYPHGKIIHVSLGVIAAGLGAVAVPSLIDKNYTAVTFLSLAAQQFREVRNMERQSLAEVDKMDLVPRGSAYIEGIAMLFEGRNYLVIFSAFITSLVSVVLNAYWGIAAGLASLIVVIMYKSGSNLEKICDIKPAEVRMDGPDLYVDSVYIMNVGLEQNQNTIRDRGMGLKVVPKNENAAVTIANLGQRQAILHNLSTILGVYRDEGEPALIPMARLNLDDGSLAVFFLPRNKDQGKAVDVLRRVPVLENAVRLPSEASAAKK